MNHILAAYIAVTENNEDSFDTVLSALNKTVIFIEEEYNFKLFLEELAANNTSGAEVSNPNAVNTKKKMSALLKRKGFKELK